MNETPQQYTARILENLEGQDPQKVQAATPKRLARLIEDRRPSQLRKQPAAGKWSVAEILAHLADCEIVTSWRMRQILAAPGTVIQAFDQDSWAAAGRYGQRDAQKSVEHFRALREANLALLKSLSHEQWHHYGIHAERGQETIAHIVSLVAGHDLNHVKQVEHILAPRKSRAASSA